MSTQTPSGSRVIQRYGPSSTAREQIAWLPTEANLAALANLSGV